VTVPSPVAPSLGGAIRAAAIDFYYNSWRLVPANLVWAAVLLAVLVVGGASIVGLALAPLLTIPTGGLFAVAARLARSEPVAFGDFVAGIRATWRAALGIGIGAVAVGLVCTTNLVVGLESDHPLGWLVAATALWGDVGLALGLLAIWPIVADPRRRGLSLRRRLRLAGFVVLLRPLRIGGLGLCVAVLLVASTILFAALLTISIAYLALLVARIVLPIADQLEAPPADGAGR
jgi:hypothetical protein